MELKEIQEAWTDKSTPRFEIDLGRVGETMLNNLYTCFSVEDTWYAVQIKRDSGKESWERAGYQHPALPPKPQNLADAIQRLQMGTLNVHIWKEFAENFILKKKIEENNGVSPSMVNLEFVAAGDKPDGVVIAYQRYAHHQRLEKEAFPARIKYPEQA